MTDELTDAEIDAIAEKEPRWHLPIDAPKPVIMLAVSDRDALVAALRSARARPKYSGDWEEAEIALRDVLDADDALEVLQTLQGLGFASAAELERERTQNLAAIVALRGTVEPMKDLLRLLTGAARSKPFTEALEKVERAWAALSTQEDAR